jgi:hypothetical protein
VAALLESVGRSRESISPDEVEQYCRNAYSLQVLEPDCGAETS